MSGEFQGVEQCLAYVRRIRSAFQRFVITTHTDAVMAPPSSSSSLPTSTAGTTVQSEWTVEAAYGGALTRGTGTTKPCRLKGVLFIKFDAAATAADDDVGGLLVSDVRMSWNASDLLMELGVLPEGGSS